MVVVKLCGFSSLIVSIEGQACSASTFGTDTSCYAGQSYDSTAAATTCTVAAACVYDETAAGVTDQDICCNPNTGQKCSDWVTDGVCGAGYTDRKSTTNKCVVADSCDIDTAYDKKSCCKATTGQKCSLAGIKDGWCKAGTTYDAGKKNLKCVGDPCDKSVLDDQNSCCSVTKGSATCKVGFEEDGVCSESDPGLTYNKDNADLKCVGSTCQSDKKDDTNTCCMVTTGLTCSKASITTGMCSDGKEYDVKKKNFKCVDKEVCDFKRVVDDDNTCCSPLKGTAKCGDVKVGATAKGFCGPGKMYNENQASKSCSGASCSKSNKDDINQCCKANDGEGVCKDMAEELCGAGKSKNPDKLESVCIGKSCGNNADDVGTCCMDNDGALCSDVKNGATEAMFCGQGLTYKIGATTKCKQAKCASGSPVDKLSCCAANDGETCSTITAVKTFCGTGKVIDTSKESEKCASPKCSAASKEDVKVCCKTAPKTTVATTTASKKNVTTPGTTGSAHANLVGTVSLFMGCLSQLM